MSTIATMLPTDPTGPEWLPSPPYRLTLEQYERMVNEGIIGEHDRVHLINGILVAKMTQNDPHCTADDLCDAALRRVIPAGWYIRGAKPIRHPRPGRPPGQQARARSLRRAGDGPRLRANAPPGRPTSPWSSRSPIPAWRKIASRHRGLRARGIPVYWIVNLVDRQVEVYTKPGPQGYRSTEIFTEGQSVPVVIGGQEVGRIAVEDILPPPGGRQATGPDRGPRQRPSRRVGSVRPMPPPRAGRRATNDPGGRRRAGIAAGPDE